MKARLISNITMDPLATELSSSFDITVGEYDSIITELLDPRSVSSSDATSHVLALFDTDTLLGDALFDQNAPSRSEAFLRALERFCESHPGKTVLANTFCATTRRAAYFSDVLRAGSAGELEKAGNARLLELAEAHQNLLLIDLELLFRRYGEDKLITDVFWYAGRVRYTPFMFRELSTTIIQAIAAYTQASFKVLVLDLDNTIWGGILGEVGPTGIELSETGVGAAYRDFQRQIKALKNTGVLLAICSKNNPGDVDELFEKNGMMILRRDDFACIRANWAPKPQSLAEIAETLNLGLDSMVFIDDSQFERRMVAEALPAVEIPPLPPRPDALPAWLVNSVARPYFGRYHLTDEDLTKTEQYQTNEARKKLATHFDLDKFISELGIVCEFSVDDPSTVVRASKMTQKTNQFNLTNLRCGIPEIQSYVNDIRRALVVMTYADRFGFEGIVGLSMLNLESGLIENFLMSCRVIGRRVEDALLSKVINVFRENGSDAVRGEYVPTTKNDMVSSFYDSHAFTLTAQGPDGRKLYERRINGS